MANKLVVAAAGSGKTTLLIDESLKFPGESVCILTYTEENEREIRSKIYQRCGAIPSNLHVQTWFSFLLRHGVRPYQGNIFECDINTLLVGDPRQVTYLTHHEKKYAKYRNGLIKNFLNENIKKEKMAFEIDEISLSQSHRNNSIICRLSSLIYPEFPKTGPCECQSCNELLSNFKHQGIHCISQEKIPEYIQKTEVIQLRISTARDVDSHSPVYNFGQSKGLTFNHCLIYPTEKMEKWLCNSSQELTPQTRAKFYVAITRARASVAFVCSETTLQALKVIDKKAA